MFDVSLTGALFAGLLSFLSPCILPIVPFYLVYLAGMGLSELSSSNLPPRVRLRTLLAALCFAGGVLTIFVALGATASAIGQLVSQWFHVLRWIAGAIIITIGLHLLGLFRIGVLNRHIRADVGSTPGATLWGAYVTGLAFAFGWTPCVGPVLASILVLAAGAEAAGRGMVLLMAYGVGMTLPFVLASAFIGPFMRAMHRFRRHLGKVEKAMGLLLVVFGLLIATDAVRLIAHWMLEVGPDIGLLG